MVGPASSAPRLPPAFPLLRRPKAALALSAAVHGALLYALSEVPWRAEPGAPAAAAPAVVWLRDGNLPADPASDDGDDPAAAGGPIVTPQRVVATEPEPAPQAAPEAPERREEAAGEDVASPLAAENPPIPAAPGIDWQAERDRVFEELAERGEDDAPYHRFGTLEELLAESPAPPQEPGPERSIFEPGRGSGTGRALLRPGQARTRAGRVLTELCQALTGGAGVALNGLALFNLCAEERYRSDLFAHLKPEYLRRRPADFVVGRGRVDLDAPVDEPVAPLAGAAAP